MNLKRTVHGVRNGCFKICRSTDSGAVEYPPTKWIKVVYTGHSKTSIRKGILNGYQISVYVQKVLDKWAELPRLDKNGPSGFGDALGSLDDLPRAITQPDNVNILAPIN